MTTQCIREMLLEPSVLRGVDGAPLKRKRPARGGAFRNDMFFADFTAAVNYRFPVPERQKGAWADWGVSAYPTDSRRRAVAPEQGASMDWVLIFSLQWVVGGVPTAPTTWTNVGYQNEQLCRAAVQAIKAEMATPIAGAETHVRAVCVLREASAGPHGLQGPPGPPGAAVSAAINPRAGAPARPESAAALDVPMLDGRPNCQYQAKQNTKPLIDCVEDEQHAHNRLVREWAEFAQQDKSKCIDLATNMTQSYVELLTCLQIAKDASTLPKDVTQGGPGSIMGSGR